jgi:hypothetical protein
MAETRKPSRERADRKATSSRSGSGSGSKSSAKAGSSKRPAERTASKRGDGARPAKGAAARRAAEKRRRQRTLLYSLVTVLVLGALAAFVVVANKKDAAPSDDDFKKQQAGLASARQAAGCTAIEEFPNAGGKHIADDVQPTNWNSNPPTSGDHLVNPLPGDFYQTEQDERNLLHSLEHGYVAVQYKNVSPDQIAKLRELQSEHTGQKFIVMPYSGLPKDGVAFSAWQHLQTCSKLDVNLAKSFIDNYMIGAGKNRSVAPEPFAQ